MESDKSMLSQTPQPKKEEPLESEAGESSFEKVDYQLDTHFIKEKDPQTKADQSIPKQDRYKILKSGGIAVGMTKEGDKEKIYYISDDTHTLTIGATRSGKTRNLVIQSICTLGLAGALSALWLWR